MNITRLIVAAICAIVFYFIAVAVLAAISFALPTIVVALVAILVGFAVYRGGVTI